MIAGARAAAVLAAWALLVSGCGGGDDQGPGKGSIETYVSRVEPIRLGVNRLLDRADPILSPYREQRLGPRQATQRMEALERRFAAYARRIAALRAIPAPLRAAHRAYAHTYVLEDSYLSALAAALPEREFEDLPATQSRQRAAIIAWRIRLEVVAKRFGIRLPADVQVAGRGEIAPSPQGD